MAKDAKAAEASFKPSIVVFGLDDGQRPHAAAFSLDDALLAERAAGLMGMTVLKVTTDEHRAAALALPVGRVFASGKAFTPFIARPMYERLTAFEGSFQPEAPAESPPLPAITHVPSTWADIGAGSIVLAAEGADVPGWFECAVVALRDDLLELRWTGWPDLPAFIRRREHVSLLSAAAHEAVKEAAA